MIKLKTYRDDWMIKIKNLQLIEAAILNFHIVSIQEYYLDINKEILLFINRLSDYLFTLARFFSKILKINELKWNIK